MKATYKVTVEEFSEGLDARVGEFTELEGVSEEEAHVRAEDLMHAVGEEGNRDSTYRISVHEVDEDGAWVCEALWATRLDTHG